MFVFKVSLMLEEFVLLFVGCAGSDLGHNWPCERPQWRLFGLQQLVLEAAGAGDRCCSASGLWEAARGVRVLEGYSWLAS